MSYQISADTGGTFIDVVVQGGPEPIIGKSLTTHDRVFRGLSSALEFAAEQLDLTAEQLISQADLFIYGTTRATNAIVTRNTAKTALLTTEGFEETLVLKEGGKQDGYDYSKQYPDPYIPRRYTFGVRERIDSEAQVLRELDESHLRDLIQRIVDDGIEAIAVSLLWSVVNPSHELRVAEIIAEIAPQIPVTLSHQIAPIIREYRRTSAAAIDASLKPLMQRHFRELESDLRDFGYQGEILVSTSLGGVMSIDEIIEAPIYAARSGPSMAPLAGIQYSSVEGLGEDMIVADTGGTTFDAGISRDGSVVKTRDTWLGPEFEGDLLGISSVDIRSLGAGGGSIAHIDAGGLLKVGPQSAGSEPGPACYGRGGTEPTVSDAACVLGYFDPDYFLGGRMQLDVEAARTALGTLAEQLDISVEEVAWGIITLASQEMVKAVHEITVAQGLNPKDSTLVAGGGAAGINIMLIAEELGSERAVLPKMASALSASGMHFADIVKDESAALITSSHRFDAAQINGLLESLDEKLLTFVDRFTHQYPTFKIEYSVEARYQNQIWTIELPLPCKRFESGADFDQLVSGFHDLHQRVYAVRDEGSDIEFLNWIARATIDIPRSPLSYQSVENYQASSPHTRDCYFGSTGRVSTPIYKPEHLGLGAHISGPAIIEEPTTTLVIYPGMAAQVSGTGNYLLQIEEVTA
ncbi:hydantoinase/oxoprolinase family protein [Leucobacter japonicus]|uniref:hydantoinase/oxoprolinase family protein n=2 Tax=Leucobacter TaxID=55968 RepID=UPI0006A797C8|nr:hydantoinase/oxoprolinase family protein [Leucobacter japonicus]